MMNKKLIHLAERRSLLIKQAAAQRSALSYNLAPWQARLSWVDRGLAGVRYMRSHPTWMAGSALVLVALLRPLRARKWLQRGWLLWQIGRRLRSR
ncbi:MAG: YqjK-like family protein [Thiobacillus sp.]|nr:YqjK-like family protein [Gammaproteobacteria bacterium]MDP3126421.1 YqjK-like family protein [Thiobacillus sp.]